jgi:hypothetical protein
MDRLSDWRAAAWLAVCLSVAAAAAAILIPAGTRHHPRAAQTKPVLRATLVPRTHLFGEPVTATIVAPVGVTVKTSFEPYRILSRTTTRAGATIRYRFVLDCLRTACIGQPGTERQVLLPPVTLVLPDGKRVVGLWPPLRQASRLAPMDRSEPALRGDLAPPDPPPARDRRTLAGILFAAAGALALGAATVLGVRKLGWRPALLPWVAPRPATSELDYALIVAGLSAGGGADDRRAALESLAVALERCSFPDLATQARGLAWSARPPAGDSVRSLAEKAQRAARGHA